MINYPENCSNEASRLSFLYKLMQVYISWFNARGLGMDNDASIKRNAIHYAIGVNRSIAISINYHSMTGLVNGEVVLPETATHGGAKLSALFALSANFKDGLQENEDYQTKETEAIAEAENDDRWQPMIGDING